MKFVVDDEGIVEAQLPFLYLMEEFDHYGDFHGAGGVEGIVGVEEIFVGVIEHAEGDGDFCAGFGDALFDLLGGGGELGILRACGNAEEKCGRCERCNNSSTHCSSETVVQPKAVRY